MTVDPCELCATGRRPSLEELVADLQRTRLEEMKAAGVDLNAQAEEEEKKEENTSSHLTHENLVRLKFLAGDLSRLVKVE